MSGKKKNHLSIKRKAENHVKLAEKKLIIDSLASKARRNYLLSSCSSSERPINSTFENKNSGNESFINPKLAINVTWLHPLGNASECEYGAVLFDNRRFSTINWVPSVPIVFDEVPQTSSKVPEMFPAMTELNNLYPETSVTVTVPEITDVVEANAASLFGMMKRLFYELERLSQQIKKLTHKHAQMNASLVGLQIDAGKRAATPIISNLIPGLNLPIQTDDDLVCLNQKLSEDTTLSSILVSYLSNISYGKHLSFFTTNLLKKKFVKDIALQYSRLGRKGKKSLEDLREIFHVLLATMSLRFPEVKREELTERLGKVLSCAKEWGNSRKRSSLVELNYLSNSLTFSDNL